MDDIDSNAYSNQSEFAALLAEHLARLYGYIYALCLNADDADDLLQQTCTVMWQKFDQFEAGTNFVAWACQIARFEVLKLDDRRRRQGKLLNELAQEKLAEAAAASRVNEEPARFESLVRCLEKLSAQDRAMVEACYGHRVPVRQFAERIERSPQSVHNSLKRIRLSLLDCVRRRADQGGPA